MILPRFKLSQQGGFVIINIRAPFCVLRELNVIVIDDWFIFSCKPYYLRIQLPGELVSDNRLSSTFDTDTDEFTFRCPKKHSDEDFKNLDMIVKLLFPATSVANCGTIPVEVLAEKGVPEVHIEDDLASAHNQYGFGFALRYFKDFMGVSSKYDDIFEINPCKVPLKERRKLKVQYEQGKFDFEYYLSELYENKEILDIITLESPYKTAKQNPAFKLTEKDFDFLRDQPNIQYDLSLDRISYCHNGLLDILFAYCYDRRTTYYEGTIESGWTITKLASTLCWHDAFTHPRDVLLSAFRRSLIYPLFRHFDLSHKVLEDLKDMIQLEEKFLIKILLKIYYIFLHGDSDRYILNNLFIKDYIIYMMKWDPDLWRSTVIDVMKIDITKDELGLNLTEIEKGNNPLAMAKLGHIVEAEEDSDDYESDSDDTSFDTSTSDYSSGSESEDTENLN